MLLFVAQSPERSDKAPICGLRRRRNVSRNERVRWRGLDAAGSLQSQSPAARRDAPSLIAKAESLGAYDMDSQLYKARILDLLGKREEALTTVAACFRRGATDVQFAAFPDLQSLQRTPATSTSSSRSRPRPERFDCQVRTRRFEDSFLVRKAHGRLVNCCVQKIREPRGTTG